MKICSSKKCVACNACILKCPQNCIQMRQTEKGWYTAKIENMEECIDCGICGRVCQGNAEKLFDKKRSFDIPLIYAVIANDKKELLRSTSGGAFFQIAKRIILNDGVVYGATMTEFKVHHIRINRITDLNLLQGSKYVESDMKGIYAKVEKDIFDGKLVLFSGTSCQIEGLYRYLGNDFKNLYTCDLLCKGVPPQSLFDSYISYLKKKYHDELRSINFRSKELGYMLLTTIETKDGKSKILRGLEDSYVKTVGKGYVREACLQCKFTQIQRIGDISLGDFWHIGEKIPFRKQTDEGCSLVLINTDKGRNLLNILEGSCYIEERSLEEAYNSQSTALSKPNSRPNDYLQFFEAANNLKWNKLAKKYLLNKNIFKRFREMIPRQLERAIIRRMKRHG